MSSNFFDLIDNVTIFPWLPLEKKSHLYKRISEAANSEWVLVLAGSYVAFTVLLFKLATRSPYLDINVDVLLLGFLLVALLLIQTFANYSAFRLVGLNASFVAHGRANSFQSTGAAYNVSMLPYALEIRFRSLGRISTGHSSTLSPFIDRTCGLSANQHVDIL